MPEEKIKVFLLVTGMLEDKTHSVVSCISTNYKSLMEWYNSQFQFDVEDPKHYFKEGSLRNCFPLDWPGKINNFRQGVITEFMTKREYQELCKNEFHID